MGFMPLRQLYSDLVRQGNSFLGAITTGCMRPFVPRTNKNELTTTVRQGNTRSDFAKTHSSRGEIL